MVEWYNQQCYEHMQKLKSPTQTLCNQAVNFDPYLIENVDPIYMNEELLDSAISSLYPDQYYNDLGGYPKTYMYSPSKTYILQLFNKYTATHSIDEKIKNRLLNHLNNSSKYQRVQYAYDKYLVAKKFNKKLESYF